MTGPADLVLNANAWKAETAAAAAEQTRLKDALAACLARPTGGGCEFDPTRIDWNAAPLTGAVTQPGVIRDRLIDRLSIRAPEVELVNCRALALLPSGTGGLTIIDATYPEAKGFRIRRCLVGPAAKSVRWHDGVRLGADGYAEATVCEETIDGWGWWNRAGGTVGPTMVDCVTRNLAWFADDPNHTDGSHNDGLQSHSPISGARIIGGDFDCGAHGTAGLMANVASVKGLYVSRARFRGGASAVNLHLATLTGVELLHSQLDSPVGLYCSRAATVTTTGSTSNGGPVVRRAA